MSMDVVPGGRLRRLFAWQRISIRLAVLSALAPALGWVDIASAQLYVTPSGPPVIVRPLSADEQIALTAGAGGETDDTGVPVGAHLADPSAPSGPDGVADAVIPPSADEVEHLRALHDSASIEDRDALKAYYRDLGWDLDQLLGITMAAQAEQMRLQELLNAMRELNFARTPAAVLAARSRIGFGQVPSPDPKTARGSAISRWLHLQVMAGEWRALGEYLAARPADEAQQVYSRILQALNQSDAGLLPEEVLAFTEACPEELPRAWQMTAWSAMLRNASTRNSPATMLAAIRDGTRYFGPDSAERRRRTVELLAGAGLVEAAYEYLPPLSQARAAEDGQLILVHGRYLNELADRADGGPEAEEHRRAAWACFTEVSRLERAPIAVRREAIEAAVSLMSRVPRPMVAPWLRAVFADDIVAPAALEVIALTAAANESPGLQQQMMMFPFQQAQSVPSKDEEARAESILALKEAVDILLERDGLDRAVLRVPLRMLTTALVAQMENAIAQRGQQTMIPRETQLLLRAIPDARWIDALEPSLAVRAAKACIGIAAVTDETDLALKLLAEAVARNPEEAATIGASFLDAWMMRLSSGNTMNDDMMMYWFWREYVAQAPLTRGRQRRNLERLVTMMQTVANAGLDARRLPGIASAFKACHGITEVYDPADVERVFGPIDAIPPHTAATLARSMAASLNGDWRNRAIQVEHGVRRTDAEIAQLVDRGYGLAINLIDSALENQPDSWRYSIVKAGLTYDRMQFRRAQRRRDEVAIDIEYRAAVFAAFEEAAHRYAAALVAGEEREDIGVYEAWFGASMGTSQLNFLTADGLPEEGSAEDDQIERIRHAIAALPGEAAFRHLSDFARVVGEAVGRSDPDVKPRLVRHALRIVGDHPAGASLRTLDELYRDLVRDEIKLRVTIDGSDRVGTHQPFGVLVSLRFTNSVDRETGGFAKYLQTSAFVRVGRQYQQVNFRERFQKSIETAFTTGFDIESIGYFDAFMPARGVIESGQGGWMEKPMAYVVLKRKDPALDRLPQMAMEMQFEDSTGPVTLVLPSNTPALAVGAHEPARRPCIDLVVTQIVDPRDARDRVGDQAIRLEVIARGKGTVPALDQLLMDFEGAIDGYTIAEDGIEEMPPQVLQSGDQASQASMMWGNTGTPRPPDEGYPEPDADGMYRLTVERSWTVTYLPAGGPRGAGFRLPSLRDGIEATVVARSYSDLDIVPVSEGFVPIDPRRGLLAFLPLALVVPVLVASAIVWRFLRRPEPDAEDAIALPDRVTPLSAITVLRRIVAERGQGLGDGRREELEREIALIELKCFGPGEDRASDDELHATLRRWAAVSSAR